MLAVRPGCCRNSANNFGVKSKKVDRKLCSLDELGISDRLLEKTPTVQHLPEELDSSLLSTLEIKWIMQESNSTYKLDCVHGKASCQAKLSALHQCQN